MKKFLFLLTILFVATAAQAADVGVSISIGQPGFYGRIDIGNAPRPELIYPQPMVIVPGPVKVVEEPLYLRVPPGHAKHWKKHCHEYNACGRPVYFVRDKWYNDVYVPHYRAHHGKPDDRNNNRDRRDGPPHRDDKDRRGPGPDHGPGPDKDRPGHGHGNGPEHGRGPDRN